MNVTDCKALRRSWNVGRGKQPLVDETDLGTAITDTSHRSQQHEWTGPSRVADTSETAKVYAVARHCSTITKPSDIFLRFVSKNLQNLNRLQEQTSNFVFAIQSVSRWTKQGFAFYPKMSTIVDHHWNDDSTIVRVLRCVAVRFWFSLSFLFQNHFWHWR
jgi:hypothetical protein